LPIRDDLPTVEADPATGVHRVRIDPNETSPLEAVVSVLELVDGNDDIETPLLYELVDPDALDTLVCDHDAKALAESMTLEIRTEEFRLVVSHVEGSVEIRLRAATTQDDPSNPRRNRGSESPA